MNLRPKQHLALIELDKSWKKLKKEKGWGFWSFLFDSEARKAREGFDYALRSILYEPQYFDENGKGINRVRADYDAGMDMRHYGWKSREDYAKEVLK